MNDRAAATGTMTAPDEFAAAALDEFREFVRRQTGIRLSDAKLPMIRRRLGARMRELNMAAFRDYQAYVQGNYDTEIGWLTDSITTNLTSFFREPHHFEFLTDTVVPDIMARRMPGRRRMRIWSAGCASGEEPYSIAIALREAIRSFAAWDILILATDLNPKVLARSEAGIYSAEDIRHLPEKVVRRWFRKCAGQRQDRYAVSQALRDLVCFRPLNLMDDWPMRGPLDAIFCRNVMIYFDKATQRTLVDRFADLLTPGGYLFIGHSENLFNLSERFEHIGRTSYRQTDL